jgi:hypothetical protein
VPAFSLSSNSLAYGGIPVDNRTTPHDKTLTTTLSNQSSCPLCDLKVTALAIIGADCRQLHDRRCAPSSAVHRLAAATASTSASSSTRELSAGAKTATLRITTMTRRTRSSTSR